MIHTKYIETESSFGHKITNLLLQHEEKSKKLVVLFPGSDGHCDGPLLHYARKVTLEAGCDVLSLEYGYLRTEGGFDKKHFDVVIKECSRAIDSVITQYDDVYFIAKSFGTLVCGGILQEMHYSGVKVVYLTPLEYTIPHILGMESTVVVGTCDKFFTKEHIDMIKGHENVTLHVIEEATHSLEIRDSFEKSLEVLHWICNLCVQFVQ
jgi:predicted alpha/beta-hydrolase family hydrolase